MPPPTRRIPGQPPPGSPLDRAGSAAIDQPRQYRGDIVLDVAELLALENGISWAVDQASLLTVREVLVLDAFLESDLPAGTVAYATMPADQRVRRAWIHATPNAPQRGLVLAWSVFQGVRSIAAAAEASGFANEWARWETDRAAFCFAHWVAHGDDDAADHWLRHAFSEAAS